jgi:hypothetical protein
MNAWYFPEESFVPYLKDALVVILVSMVIAAMIYVVIEELTNYFDK